MGRHPRLPTGRHPPLRPCFFPPAPGLGAKAPLEAGAGGSGTTQKPRTSHGAGRIPLRTLRLGLRSKSKNWMEASELVAANRRGPLGPSVPIPAHPPLQLQPHRHGLGWSQRSWRRAPNAADPVGALQGMKGSRPPSDRSSPRLRVVFVWTSPFALTPLLVIRPARSIDNFGRCPSRDKDRLYSSLGAIACGSCGKCTDQVAHAQATSPRPPHQKGWR
jgi:hypothetical protein